MADHNSLIGGVAAEIEGGNILIDGMEYEIESGTVLSDGAAMEIKFTGGFVEIAISGNLAEDYAYVIVGSAVITAAETMQAVPGLVISVYALSPNTTAGKNCYIAHNGLTVRTGQGSYSFELTKNTTIVFSRGSVTVSGRLQPYYTAKITTS